jgi:Right handed beta helix region
MERRTSWRSALCTIGAAVLIGGIWTVVTGPSSAGAAGRSAASGTSLHVDCQAPDGGNGSSKAPLNSLAEASAATLLPGQRLLFARGTVCSGSLEVDSSGTSGEPITVGAYGKGALPQIAGTAPDAVLLENASYVTVENLEITNEGATDVERRGVHVVADGVLVQGVTLERLDIHDVDGNLSKDTGGSGGIQLDALGTSPDGRFDGVTITDNQIENVSRSGIFVVGTQDDSRPPATEQWDAGSTGIVVSGNSLAHLAGDGIVATGTVGAVLEDNTVTDGNRAGTSYTEPNAICDAGIWAWNANSSVIQDNVVSDMEFNGCDGEGYDVDYNQDGTIVQDNVSEDNGGGFILLCTDEEPHNAVVRYNLSVDDAATIEDAPCDIANGNVGTLDGILMDNNTFVAPDPQVDLELVPLSSMFNPGDFGFVNNIVDASTSQSTEFPCGNDCTNNLFFQLPASGTNAVVGDPQFKDPIAQGTKRTTMAKGFRVGRKSPAIGAGAVINGGATQDFFGKPVPAGQPPTIGFSQAS